jgi:predicted amidophosphoribosyltransferase
LSKLEGYLAPPCPGCGKVLPLDSKLAACPRCKAAVDVAALIVKFHGPEKLAQCYGPGMLSSESEMVMDETCGCGYDLHGLPRRGLCPECGAPFSKRGVDEW